MSRRNTPEDFAQMVDMSGGADTCWPWSGPRDEKGYGRFYHDGTYTYAHREALSRALGGLADDLDSCHHCDNPPCCNPSHLYAGTHQENMRDRDRRGRRIAPRGAAHHAHRKPERLARGEAVGGAILNAAQVVEIREGRASGRSLRTLGEQYGVTLGAVHRLCTGKTWAHVGGPIQQPKRYRTGGVAQGDSDV